MLSSVCSCLFCQVFFFSFHNVLICLVMPFYTSVSHCSFSLSLLYSDPPGPPQISGYDGRTLTVNSNLDLTCISRGGNPVGQVEWYRNGSPVKRNHAATGTAATNNFSFRVQASDHKARYTCKVSSTSPNMASQNQSYVLSVYCEWFLYLPLFNNSLYVLLISSVKRRKEWVSTTVYIILFSCMEADLPLILILSKCTDFFPSKFGNIQISPPSKFGNIQIFSLKIWQNTDLFVKC